MDGLKTDFKIPLETKLDEELERLKRLSGLGTELSVKWHPDGGNPLAGEVIGKTIQVYEADEAKAMENLRHEFLDYNVSQAIIPYKAFANLLVKQLNAEAYKQKEIVVEGLIKLLSAKTTEKEEVAEN